VFYQGLAQIKSQSKGIGPLAVVFLFATFRAVKRAWNPSQMRAIPIHAFAHNDATGV
jgi:hypothetical protein